jgi:thioredoxin reductase (NADPH)
LQPGAADQAQRSKGEPLQTSEAKIPAENGIGGEALIIGAGPSGLYLAFQLGLLDIPCRIVDSLPAIGGQCYELYADKPIFDIPGFESIKAIELAERLWKQAQVAKPELQLNRTITQIEAEKRGGFLVKSRSTQALSSQTDEAETKHVQAVFIAAGIGAFATKRLRLEGAQSLEGTCLFYSVLPSIPSFKSKQVLISGGGKRALGLVLHLLQCPEAHAPDRIDVIARNGLRQAADQEHEVLLESVRHAAAAGRIRIHKGVIAGFELSDQVAKLEAVRISLRDDPTASEGYLPSNLIVVCHGLSPRLEPMLHWHLGMTRGQIPVDTARFESRVPGVFVIGDMASYPGKKKLIACGFHEATLAAYAACDYFFPGKTIHLQYTTSSPRLLAKLSR